MEPVDISGQSAAELSRLDRLVHCPMILQLSVANVVCGNESLPANQCGAGVLDESAVRRRLRERLEAGARPSLATLDPIHAYSAPFKPDF